MHMIIHNFACKLQVTVAWKNQLIRPNDRQLKRVAHYKVTDKSISIMPVGLSAAVL